MGVARAGRSRRLAGASSRWRWEGRGIAVAAAAAPASHSEVRLVDDDRRAGLAEWLRRLDQRTVDVHPDMYARLLQTCGKLKALAEGKQLHAQIIKCGLEKDLFLGNHLLDMYGKCGSVDHVQNLFDKMPEKNLYTWAGVIAAYAHKGCGKQALRSFKVMQLEGSKPDKIMFLHILSACSNSSALAEGRRIHELVIEAGLRLNLVVGNALVHMYGKCGSLQDARRQFDEQPLRDVVAYTTMINAYAAHGQYEQVLELFAKMEEKGVTPNNITLVTVLTACAKFGNMEEARKNFERTDRRDIISWNAIISAHSQHGDSREAIRLFHELQSKKSLKPTAVTFISVLDACANLAALAEGKLVHGLVLRFQPEYNVVLATALVNMYSKCGSLEDAKAVFDGMHQHDNVSWTAMVAAYAQHGHAKEAMQTFQRMQEEGHKPNHITFIHMLAACSHGGLVKEGRRYFDLMTERHGIPPSPQHYGCMIDLLGRAGHLDEAEEFVKKMPCQPHAAALKALLGACRNYNDVERGKRVAEKMLELDPQCSTPYVVLASIYRAAGKWEEAARLRKLMLDRGVKKEPGCSAIEVDGKVHDFVAGDTAHPQTRQILVKLDELSKQMKEAGYVPDTKLVLHDVGEEEKEQLLFWHSEKLAIAFGLIATPAGTPLRIIKNLRVCKDCHNAAKFISSISQREIVVRDYNRFHQFKQGVCSCGDYW